jgi:hypothetical protein
VREHALINALDEWLEEFFAPGRARDTARLVTGAEAPSDHDDMTTEARDRLQAARQRLVQYRRALDDGADTTTVTAWITEAAEHERAAQADVNDTTSSARSTGPRRRRGTGNH